MSMTAHLKSVLRFFDGLSEAFRLTGKDVHYNLLRLIYSR